MTPQRWQQIRQLFENALERPAAERPAWLEGACGADAELRREVEEMLVAEESAGDFLEAPPRQLAAQVVEEKPTALPTLVPGQQLDHYEIIALLGRGGMGEVYLARDRKLGRQVAIKLLPAVFTGNPIRVRRFEQEARAVSALNHPNITMIFEVGQVERGHFIVMEFVEGQTLRAALASGALSLVAKLDAAVQIASALVAAHQAGVVHRDIKPENIMLRHDGYIKVLDFGLAKLTKTRTSSDQTLRTTTQSETGTTPGTVMGTISYMSPEQARGQEVDARSDLFSLGVMFYEMITGSQPFQGETSSDVLAAILKTEPPPLAALAPATTASLQPIITQALRKDRQDRYQTAAALLGDLRQLKQRLEWEAAARLASSGPGGELPVAETMWSAMTTNRMAAAHSTSSAEYLINEIKRHKRAAVLALIALVLTVAGLLYFSFGGERQAIDSIAVVPFNVGADANLEYLSDGVADSLINSLSSLPHLKVMSLSSVSRYKGHPVDSQAVGQELKVRAVLLGRMTQRGDELMMSLELVNARDNSRLWGHQYQRKLTDLLATQSEIAREISEKLRPSLSGVEQQRVAKHHTESTAAYQLYLKGRYYWNKRTGEGLQRGIEFFDQAIAQDPSYALAYAGLADCYGLLPNYNSLPAQEALPKARAAAQRALEMDETLAEAHTSLGLVKKDYEWDFAGAEKEFGRAIELNPNYPTAYQWRAENFVNLKRYDDAIATMKRAQELDPFSLIINGEVGWVYYQARQPDRAVESLRKAADLDPNFPRTHFFLGRAYEQQRSFEPAIGETQRAIALAGRYPLYLASLGHIYGRAGQATAARQLLDELRARTSREYISPVALALIHTGLDEPDQAFIWLEKAYQERDTILSYYLLDPQLESLRSDPRFAELAHRIRLEP